jgi:hypothetical protein
MGTACSPLHSGDWLCYNPVLTRNSPVYIINHIEGSSVPHVSVNGPSCRHDKSFTIGGEEQGLRKNTIVSNDEVVYFKGTVHIKGSMSRHSGGSRVVVMRVEQVWYANAQTMPVSGMFGCCWHYYRTPIGVVMSYACMTRWHVSIIRWWLTTNDVIGFPHAMLKIPCGYAVLGNVSLYNVNIRERLRW